MRVVAGDALTLLSGYDEGEEGGEEGEEGEEGEDGTKAETRVDEEDDENKEFRGVNDFEEMDVSRESSKVGESEERARESEEGKGEGEREEKEEIGEERGDGEGEEDLLVQDFLKEISELTQREEVEDGGRAGEEWQTLWDEAHQAHYYWNTRTQETSWVLPPGLVAPTSPVNGVEPENGVGAITEAFHGERVEDEQDAGGEGTPPPPPPSPPPSSPPGQAAGEEEAVVEMAAMQLEESLRAVLGWAGGSVGWEGRRLHSPCMICTDT